MFYFFFESRNSTNDPVVIWLTGGPGCSSELALFYENGPFTIANNLSLVWNEYGWDKVCNDILEVFYIDDLVICIPFDFNKVSKTNNFILRILHSLLESW